MSAIEIGIFVLNTVSCGGNLTVRDPREVSYEAVPTSTAHGCAWVIGATSSGPLEIRLVPDDNLALNSNFTLRAVYKRNATLCAHTDIMYETFKVIPLLETLT